MKILNPVLFMEAQEFLNKTIGKTIVHDDWKFYLIKDGWRIRVDIDEIKNCLSFESEAEFYLYYMRMRKAAELLK